MIGLTSRNHAPLLKPSSARVSDLLRDKADSLRANAWQARLAAQGMDDMAAVDDMNGAAAHGAALRCPTAWQRQHWFTAEEALDPVIPRVPRPAREQAPIRTRSRWPIGRDGTV